MTSSILTRITKSGGASLEQLPLRVRHGRHETAISMLSRLAVRNGYDSVSELLTRVPNLRYQSSYNREKSIWIAAALNGVDEQELARSSPARVGANLVFNGTDVLSGRGPIQGRVCAHCLDEDVRFGSGPVECRAYLRDWWQVAQVTTCPRHAVNLIGSCDSCSNWLNIRRLRARYCPCGFDLAKAKVSALDEADIAADAYLLGRLGRMPLTSVPLIDDLSFTSAATLMLFVGIDPASHNSLPRSWDPGSNRARVSSQGLRILQQGWEAFDQRLAAILVESVTSRSVVGSYGRLQRWLKDEPASDLAPFRQRLVDHARANKAFSMKETMFGQAVEGSRWTTMLAASQYVGRNAGPIYRVAQAMGLGEHVTGHTRDAHITFAAMEKVRGAFISAKTASQACRYLGVYRDQLSRYVKAGLVRELCPAEATAASYYSDADLRDFADAVLGDAEPCSEANDDLISLYKAGRLLGGGVDRVVAALYHGEIRAKARLPGKDGSRDIKRALVARSDVRALRLGFPPDCSDQNRSSPAASD